VGTDREAGLSGFLEQLAVERFLVGFLGRDPAAGGDPEVAAGEDQVDQEDRVAGREDQRADTLAAGMG
jgi:hypothetical protein